MHPPPGDLSHTSLYQGMILSQHQLYNVASAGKGSAGPVAY